ncbi:hypothetical protein PENANT_c002G08209 [Penicillium antarcticum]|uniref:Uncharacterized protein n=1 Tax=Penicillium antarcticum TaxID=416450 RepID=A0A1V6QKN8_9EURO|nr:hypothetical protein PENANT_c002G08209 [Penicillium antarcticum]
MWLLTAGELLEKGSKLDSENEKAA